MTKKTHRQKLVKELDILAKSIARKRDGRCLLCGSTENLQAHHYIHTVAYSTKYRWDLRNLCTVCAGCHLYKIHSTASFRYTEPLRKAVLINKIITEKELEEISNDRELARFSIGDLESIKEHLEEEKKKLEEIK